MVEEEAVGNLVNDKCCTKIQFDQTMDLKWNKNLAYAVGLFVSDGYLSIDGRHLDFTSKDIEQIENFKQCLSITTPISLKSNGHNNRDYFRIQFSNVALYKFFNKIGITNNKSLTISQVEINVRFFADFLRGLLDGDGSISLSKHPESKFLQVKIRFASGSKNFLVWLMKNIKNETTVTGGFLVSVSRCWQLVYGKNDSQKLIRYMYSKDNIICLSRKKATAMSVLRLQEEQNKVK